MSEIGMLHKFWIRLWYNDVTRFVMLLGIPSAIITVAVWFIFGYGEYLRFVAMASYLLLFGWMMLDNDYSNLHRIGLNEYGNKLEVSDE